MAVRASFATACCRGRAAGDEKRGLDWSVCGFGAGADFMLVPSRFEPCGLIQLHAMQYGTVPLVSSTGAAHPPHLA